MNGWYFKKSYATGTLYAVTPQGECIAVKNGNTRTSKFQDLFDRMVKDLTTPTKAEHVVNELRSALSAMMTFFGMDEDESSKVTFDKARQALSFSEIVTRPLEPWERQSLEEFRACVHRWHEKAVGKGYDGVESMCDLALSSGTESAEGVMSAARELVRTYRETGNVLTIHVEALESVLPEAQ